MNSKISGGMVVGLIRRHHHALTPLIFFPGKKKHLVRGKPLCVASQIYSIHRKHSNTAIRAWLLWMKILHQLSIILCIISVVKNHGSITLALPQPHILYVYRTNGNIGLHSLLAIQIYKTSLSIPAWLHMDNLSQICQELVQMSIKTHLQYWGIPVKHNITVKVTNHLNHTDFSKNIQLCASRPITSSRTVLPLWKWVPTVLAQLMV